MSRSPAVRRLLKELAELNREPSSDIWVKPLENNLLEWHFSIRGPEEGGFAGGRYHGRIVFPPEYPFKAPNISFLNANGRFEVNQKICLSITEHHPESWQPSWGVRTALTALTSFLPTPSDGAIGALDLSEGERATLARRSRTFQCSICGCDHAGLFQGSSSGPASGSSSGPGPSFSTRPPASATSPVTPTAAPAPTPTLPDDALRRRRAWVERAIAVLVLALALLLLRRMV